VGTELVPPDDELPDVPPRLEVPAPVFEAFESELEHPAIDATAMTMAAIAGPCSGCRYAILGIPRECLGQAQSYVNRRGCAARRGIPIPLAFRGAARGNARQSVRIGTEFDVSVSRSSPGRPLTMIG